MRSLTQYIKESSRISSLDDLNESQKQLSIDEIRNYVRIQRDLGFKIEGKQLDDIVNVFLTYYDIDEVCMTLNISTSPKDTAFSKIQKIKTEFRKLV